MLLHHMTIVSFRLLRKNVDNLREFLSKWFTAPPPLGKRFPIRLWEKCPISKAIVSGKKLVLNFE